MLSVSYNVGDWTLFGRWSYVPEIVSGNGIGVVGDAFLANTTFAGSELLRRCRLRWNVTDNFTLTG